MKPRKPTQDLLGAASVLNSHPSTRNPRNRHLPALYRLEFRTRAYWSQGAVADRYQNGSGRSEWHMSGPPVTGFYYADTLPAILAFLRLDTGMGNIVSFVLWKNLRGEGKPGRERIVLEGRKPV